jgi:hypothetical protein
MSKKNNGKKIAQLIFVVIMLSASGFVIYKNFASEKQSFMMLENFNMNSQDNSSFENAVKILDDSRFKNLIKFGNWPLSEGEKGRANPFIKL